MMGSDINRLKEETKEEVITTQQLPIELKREIITRVPISYHPVASKICQEYGKYIRSREVYDERAKIHKSETVIHISLMSEKHVLEWYTLQKEPFVDEFVLHPLPQFPVIPLKYHNLIASGSRIYAISWANHENLYVDCKHYVTVPVPSTTCKEPLAVIKEQLYVLGDLNLETSSAFFKSLDIAGDKDSNEWKVLALGHSNLPIYSDLIVMNNKIYFLARSGRKCIVFDPDNLTMERSDSKAMGRHSYDSSCVINNRLFCFEKNNKLKVHVNGKTWVHVRGLKNMLPKFDSGSTRLFNLSGKLLILQNSNRKDISVTVVSLEDRNGEIWGNVFSSNIALRLPYRAFINHALEVEL